MHEQPQQMGLALHNYLDANLTFPGGGLYSVNDNPVYSANGSSLRSNYIGWAVAILPYMEQARSSPRTTPRSTTGTPPIRR
jgi:hypothetical protein